MRVLVLNAGSATLKASLVEEGVALARASATWSPGPADAADRSATLRRVLADVGQTASIDVVAHRIVHGGTRFVAPARIDDATLAVLESLAELAPLHNPPATETIRAARSVLPDAPHVACFDTAFHATLPEHEARYPVPERWTSEWGIRRFGFHGLSVDWAAGRAGELLGRPPESLELVVAHLGGGCSVTAVSSGRSVWTSMGFTPLEGLMMGTRSGSIDPGILLHLLRRDLLDIEELADALDHRSGLLGVSGVSGDLREVEAAADGGDARARLALEMFASRAAAAIAAAGTTLPRLDALVFTGGIGEHAGRVRAAIVERLAVLGVPRIPPHETGEDRVLAGGRPAVLRVEAREDLIAARLALLSLRSAADAPPASQMPPAAPEA